jgi:sulfopyruvate decarboxylase TPP-binding subunit
VSEKEAIGLTEGERYTVTTDKDQRSKGVFRGYTMIGGEPAIVMQLSGGMTRFIPIVRILYIDMVGPAEQRKAEEKRPESGYYG